MDQSLTPSRPARATNQVRQAASTLYCWLLSALLFSSAGIALADDSLRDPTAPPASISMPAGDNTLTTGSPIQLITIAGRQRSARVRGITVKVGDSISEGRIVKITHNGIVVKSSDGYSLVKLFPAVNKHTPARPIPPSSIHSNQR